VILWQVPGRAAEPKLRAGFQKPSGFWQNRTWVFLLEPGPDLAPFGAMTPPKTLALARLQLLLSSPAQDPAHLEPPSSRVVSVRCGSGEASH
jgi:hypothetical protein